MAGQNTHTKKTSLFNDRIYKSPVRLLFIIVLSVFIAEALIMLLLSFCHSISMQTWAFLDATLLIMILSPVLYFFGFRPFILHIRERKLAEKTTELAYAELRQVFHTAADGMRLIDKNFTILRLNETFAGMACIERKNAIGEKCYKVFPGPQCHTANCSLRRILSGEERVEFETIRENRNGNKVPCIVTVTPFRSPNGELLGIVEDFRDITKRKKAERALRESEEKLNAILQSIGDLMIMIDKNLNIIWVNDIAKRFFGDDITGKKCYEIFHERTNACEPRPCFALRAFQDGRVHKYNTQIVSNDNKTIYFHCTANVALKDKDGNPNGVLVISRDITESKKLEQQLLQAQKMEAIGQLAGGIAHDFNNILTAIVGYGHLLQTELKSDDPLNDYMTIILNAAQRAANLTRALLAFSRNQLIKANPINLNEIIIVMEKLLSRLIGEDIELSTMLSDQDLTIIADTTQIEQVLMNLATNARDAMPDGGNLIIKTEKVEFDEEYIRAHGYGKPGYYALLSVEDTGEGMDEKTKEKIFEPFFTTKEVGKGTGLGLAMVYGIIKQHEGYINVYSEPDRGTTFKIYLPMITSMTEEIRLSDVAVVRGGSETILVIEDDVQVRELTKKVLERAGYKVIEAVDGRDAAEVFHDYKDGIDLVILDVIMPKRNGKEVYEDIKKIRKDIKVLFTSGYTSDIIHKKGILIEEQNFILKPASPHELLKTVREVLNKISVIDKT